MKKLFVLFIFLLSFLFVKAQDTRPAPTSPVIFISPLISYSIAYNKVDSTVWIYKGALYGWTKLSGDLRHWWTLLTTDVTGQDTVFTRISNRDSVSMALYRLIIDTTRLKGTATVFDLRSYKVLDDSSKYYEKLVNKVTSISGASTDIQYPSAKLLYDQLVLKKDLSDSIDVDGYTRRDRFTTGLNTKYGGSGASGQVAFHTAARTLLGDNGLFWDNVNKRLGIGKVNPVYDLDIYNTTAIVQLVSSNSVGASSFKALNNGTAQINIKADGSGLGAYTLFGVSRANLLEVFTEGGGMVIGTLDVNDLTFGTNNTGNVIIKNGGKVGIETKVPAEKLDVGDGITATASYIRMNALTTNQAGLQFATAGTVNWYLYRVQNTTDLAFNDGIADRMYLKTGGSVIIGGADPLGYKFYTNGTAGFATSVTTPTIKLTTGGLVGDFWKKTNVDGSGEWTTVAATQVYNGAWDATDNLPHLEDGTGTNGNYYHCTTAGTQTFGGVSIDFTTEDDIQYNGSIWQIVYGRAYTLQTISASVLGGAKLGGSLQVNSDILNINNFNAGALTITGTGSDVGKIWTLNNGVVSLANMEDMATASLIYRKTAGDGAPEVNSLATLKTDLGLTGTNTGDNANTTNISGTTNYLSKFTSTTAIGNSQIFDDGTNIGFGWASSNYALSFGNTFGKKIALFENIGGGNIYGFGTVDFGTGYRIQIFANGTEYISLLNTGNAGFGYTDPGTYRVKINGTTYSDGVITTGTTGTSTDWNEAHSWGNHASAGYGLSSALTTHAALTTTAHGLGASAFHADNFFATAAQTFYIGTTQVAINRGSGALTLAGLTLTTPNLGTPSALVGTNITGTATALNIGGNAATATILATTRAINGVNFNGSAAITIPSNIAVGTSGNVMTSNGSVWTSAAPAGGGGGTVTSVAAITLGTTGTDLSSTVANGTTTPVITLQVPTASASNRGALSAANWTTFNNKLATNGSAASLTSFPDNWLINSGNDATSGTLTATNFILSSDRRLKTNIKPITNLSKFDNIKFYQFNMKNDLGQLRYGSMADEVELIAPELVYTAQDSMKTKSVAYTDMLIGIVARQAELIKDLQKRVEILEKK